MKVVVRRTNKKIVSLTVDEYGILQVLAYKKLTLQRIKEIVESKREWIEQQSVSGKIAGAVADVQAVATEPEPDVHTSTDKNIADMFCGKKCLLCGEVYTVKPTVESKCYLENNSIYLPEKFFSQKDTRLKALKTYLKKLSAQFVSNEIARFGSQSALCPTKIEFRNLGASWVKCTQPNERMIILDYRIVQLSAKLQHYIIVHAFSHFTNEGHDDAFWNTVSNYLPHYRNYVEELKHYSFLKEI